MNMCTVLCYFNFQGKCLRDECVDMTALVPEPEPEPEPIDTDTNPYLLSGDELARAEAAAHNR
jgi:hypothetical protein